MTTPDSQSEDETASLGHDGPLMLDLLRQLAVLQAQFVLQAAEVERLKQVCCPWQAYSWHRWPH